MTKVKFNQWPSPPCPRQDRVTSSALDYGPQTLGSARFNRICLPDYPWTVVERQQWKVPTTVHTRPKGHESWVGIKLSANVPLPNFPWKITVSKQLTIPSRWHQHAALLTLATGTITRVATEGTLFFTSPAIPREVLDGGAYKSGAKYPSTASIRRRVQALRPSGPGLTCR